MFSDRKGEKLKGTKKKGEKKYSAIKLAKQKMSFLRLNLNNKSDFFQEFFFVAVEGGEGTGSRERIFNLKNTGADLELVKFFIYF